MLRVSVNCVFVSVMGSFVVDDTAAGSRKPSTAARTERAQMSEESAG